MSTNFNLLTVQTFAPNKLESSKKLDQYVGIAHKMPSSVNLFLNVKHLVDPSISRVSFMTISLPGDGSKEHVLTWGTYDKLTSKFYLDNGCNYKSYAKMGEIMNVWKSQGYKSIMAAKENKIRSTMAQYINNSIVINNMFGGSKIINDENTYKNMKYYLSYALGKLELSQLIEACPDYHIYVEDMLNKMQYTSFEMIEDLEHEDFLEDLQDELINYEKGLNIVSVLSEIKGILGPYINKITDEFMDTFSKSSMYYESNLGVCPTIDYCRKNVDDLLCGYVNYVNESELLG